jgi:hypothetical protein
MSEDAKVILNFVYFNYNRPYNFIERCWNDDVNLSNHIKSIYENCGYSVIDLITKIDRENQIRLIEWISNNYKGI